MVAAFSFSVSLIPVWVLRVLASATKETRYPAHDARSTLNSKL